MRKLIDIGKQYSDNELISSNLPQPQSPEDIKSIGEYKIMVRHLQEENLRLMTEIKQLCIKIEQLQSETLKNQEKLDDSHQQITNLDGENEILANLVLDKDKLIEQLMSKISRVTGQTEVYIGNVDPDANFDTESITALTSLANKYYASDESKSEVSDLLKDFTEQDFEEFESILNLKKL